MALVAALALTGCQPAVDISRAKVDRSLPPAQEVLIPLVIDENWHKIVPDAIRGKQVFEQHCAVCHGMNGDGKGPMAYTLVAPDKDVLTAFLGLFGITLHRPSLSDRPFSFANRDIENVVTPAILFETVTLGRPHLAMPAFGPEASFGANKAETLSNADRWDANVYEMMFRTTPEELSTAKALYNAQ
ncbi:MAG TPA: cytochrome c, partial [bacterium]|nr:cytochrome c [bacterium]